MSSREASSARTLLTLGAAFLLLLGSGSGLAWLLARHGWRTPLKILLITPPPGPSAGLDPAQCRAIGSLVADHLESVGGFAVTTVTVVPDPAEPSLRQARVLLVQVDSRRQGDDLELSYRFAWGKAFARPGAVPWVLRKGAFLPPAQAFDRMFRGFPQAIQRGPDSLVPKMARVFWDLVQSSAWRLRNEHLEEASSLAEQATRQEPACASAWILLGNLRYRQMLGGPVAGRQEKGEAEALLQRGLTLAPGHPRAAFLLALLEADSGNQREALDLLLRARRKQPHNPTLLTGIAYAARGAGLLHLSRRAMDLRDSLGFTALQTQAVNITCLYTGEIDRFEASLQEQPGHLRSTSGVLPFYRGYLALVRGDRGRAHLEFQSAAELAHGYPNILRLSKIFQLILEGKRDPAWKALQEYDQERIGMREQDGEFTIRLAEAYALLGDRASAMEMASRAFARGFGCTEWYERSPMLAPLRPLPKWQALTQHLRERQALMENRFPVGLLEDN